MSFAEYLIDNDEIMFSAFCVLFSSQIEPLLKRTYDTSKEFKTTCREATSVQLTITLPPIPNTVELLFKVSAAGRSFSLAGICTLRDYGDFSVHAGGLYFYYRPEHSYLLKERDFCVTSDEAAFASWEKAGEVEDRRLMRWWKKVEQNEILARLSV